MIYHPEGTFADNDSKKALCEDITKIYTSVGLPAFYVVVQFVTMPKNTVWVGAELRDEKPFIRIVVEHIAVHQPNEDKAYKRLTGRLDAALQPHIADKGYDWEYHVDETERRLWKVNGLYAPPFRSEAEKEWFTSNKPTPWEESET
jgi:hypothetical protein